VRFAISIVAALMILGLAAFGIVSAQKMSTASSQAIAASDSTADPAPQAAPATARRHPVNPVSQIAQLSGEPAPAPSVAPMQVAEATPATAPAAASAVLTWVAQATNDRRVISGIVPCSEKRLSLVRLSARVWTSDNYL
jgi:hypothetical protein